MMSLSGNELCAARQCLAEGEARALAKIKSIRKSWLFVLACTMQYQALRILLIFTSIIPVLSFPSLRYGAVNLGGFFFKGNPSRTRPIPILGLCYVLVSPPCAYDRVLFSWRIGRKKKVRK